jgi:hypothetical protein
VLVLWVRQVGRIELIGYHGVLAASAAPRWDLFHGLSWQLLVHPTTGVFRQNARIRRLGTGGLVHVGGAVDIRRRGCVPMTRLKRKERRNSFRQSACDRSTILAGARYEGRPAPGAAEVGATGETKKAAQRLFGNQALT